MLRPDRGIERVYLHRAPVDMRKQIDGLVILAKDVIQQDPTSGALFAFINARRNKLKLLVWERNGFVVWYKRLERDKFHWPRSAQQDVVTINGEQLNWLLDGYNVWRMKAHEALRFSVFS
jgi:transposase